MCNTVVVPYQQQDCSSCDIKMACYDNPRYSYSPLTTAEYAVTVRVE
jgi:hypothetical protein